MSDTSTDGHGPTVRGTAGETHQVSGDGRERINGIWRRTDFLPASFASRAATAATGLGGTQMPVRAPRPATSDVGRAALGSLAMKEGPTRSQISPAERNSLTIVLSQMEELRIHKLDYPDWRKFAGQTRPLVEDTFER